MKIITIDFWAMFCLVVSVVVLFLILLGAAILYVSYRNRQRRLEQSKKLVELEQRLRKMSDLDLKLWLAGLRKNIYSCEYNASEMRQIIKAEIKRRGFVLSSLRNFKV